MCVQCALCSARHTRQIKQVVLPKKNTLIRINLFRDLQKQNIGNSFEREHKHNPFIPVFMFNTCVFGCPIAYVPTKDSLKMLRFLLFCLFFLIALS